MSPSVRQHLVQHLVRNEERPRVERVPDTLPMVPESLGLIQIPQGASSMQSPAQTVGH